MTTATLRPTSTSFDTSQLINAATAHAALSDNSDSSVCNIWSDGGPYRAYVIGFSGFTLPAGNVVKSVTTRQRAITPSGTASHQLVSGLTINSTFYGNNVTFPYGGWATLSGAVVSGVAFTEAQINGSQMDGAVVYGDSAGLYVSELYLDVVHAAPPTTSAVTTTPSGTITTTHKPTVGWTYTQGSDGSAQSNFRVKIFTAAVYGGGGFDPATSSAAYDSGQVASGSASHALSTSLANGVTYKAYVQTYQTTSGVNQPSGYVAGSAFTIGIVVPVPTSVVPSSGSTVTTSRPTLDAAFTAIADSTLIRREWYFASDSGFTANLLTVTESTGHSSIASSLPFTFPALPARRAQGVWYVKCRCLDADGIYGSYSTATTFTVSHPPTTASRAPTAGGTIQYSTTPTVTWTFSETDTDDFQLKYQVQMWKTSTPGTVLDSGVVTSANLFHQISSGIDATWKNTELRWIVKVWDQDNIAGSFSPENTFYLRDLPVVTAVPAEAAVVTTASPLVTWSNTFSGGATQAQWKVDIVRASVVQETSGWVSGTALLYQVQTPVVTVGPTHQVVVTVVDSNGLTGSDTNNFTATYAATTIPTFTIDASQYFANGLNIIDWTAATADGNFYSWKVLRRELGTLAWTTVMTTQTVGTRTYRDFLAPANQVVEYVVVQTDISIGSVLVESVYVPQQTSSSTDRYMLVCPEDESLNITLYQVHTDSFGDEFESATINLIGRGRRVEYGDRYGQIGSLTSSLRDIEGGLTAREQRLAIEALRASNRTVYFRNPFGDVYKASMPSAQFDRVSGVGLREYMELSLDYLEITA